MLYDLVSPKDLRLLKIKLITNYNLACAVSFIAFMHTALTTVSAEALSDRVSKMGTGRYKFCVYKCWTGIIW